MSYYQDEEEGRNVPSNDMQTADDFLVQRYRQPATVVAMLKSAGSKAAEHLLRILNDPSFEGLPINTQLMVITKSMDLAFGKVEAASVFEKQALPDMDKPDTLSMTQELRKLNKTDWTPPELRDGGERATGRGGGRGDAPALSDRRPGTNVVRMPKTKGAA